MRFRKKPDFDTWEARGLVVSGSVLALLGFGFCYLMIVGLINELKSIRRIGDINLPEICAGLFGPPLALVGSVGPICWIVNGTGILIQKRNWMRGTAKARTTIVDRREVQSITAFDYKYGGYTVEYEFILQATGQQGVPALDGQFIRATVSKRIYNRYAHRDSVDIYYSTDSPLTFMIRGE